MEFEPVLSGITFGLALAFMLGPVFFTLLQTSIQEGVKAGLHFAFGVFLSDAALIFVCYTFADQLDLLNEHSEKLSIIGGTVLVGFGLFQLLKKAKVKDIQDTKSAVHAHYLLKGFMLNTLNPMVLLFWLSVVGIVASREHYTEMHELMFFISVVGTVFLIDTIKCKLANRLKRLMTEKFIHRLNLGTGLVLIGFGVEMIVRTFI